MLRPLTTVRDLASHKVYKSDHALLSQTSSVPCQALQKTYFPAITQFHYLQSLVEAFNEMQLHLNVVVLCWLASIAAAMPALDSNAILDKRCHYGCTCLSGEVRNPNVDSLYLQRETSLAANEIPWFVTV